MRSTVGAVMSLRKSPTLTPALLAAHRQNAKKSTGPRMARVKVRSCTDARRRLPPLAVCDPAGICPRRRPKTPTLKTVSAPACAGRWRVTTPRRYAQPLPSAGSGQALNQEGSLGTNQQGSLLAADHNSLVSPWSGDCNLGRCWWNPRCT